MYISQSDSFFSESHLHLAILTFSFKILSLHLAILIFFPLRILSLHLAILIFFSQNSEFTSRNSDFFFIESQVYMSQFCRFLWILSLHLAMLIFFLRIINLHLTILTFFLEFCISISQLWLFSSEFWVCISQFWFFYQNFEFTSHNYDFFHWIPSLHLAILPFSLNSKFTSCNSALFSEF